MSESGKVFGEGYFFLEEHTADAAFVSCGRTLEDVFRYAGKALTDLMVEIDKVLPRISRRISVRDEDIYGLMRKWLEELIFLLDAEGLIFSEFKVSIKKEEGEYVLEAEAKGEKYDPERHSSKVEVKAVSYHWMAYWEKDGLKCMRVLVDI